MPNTKATYSTRQMVVMVDDCAAAMPTVSLR